MVVKAGDGVDRGGGEAARRLRDAGVRVELDERVDIPFGRRAVDWELKGVPGTGRGGPA